MTATKTQTVDGWVLHATGAGRYEITLSYTGARRSREGVEKPAVRMATAALETEYRDRVQTVVVGGRAVTVTAKASD